jgi:cbb3-type cytochrome oxidase maturation protein
MESLTLLVPLSVAVVFLIGGLFWRALQGGQFDDLDRPGHDVLLDDDRIDADQKQPNPLP